MRSDKDPLVVVDKARLCYSKKVDLSTDYFIKLIGERVQDCEAWEKKLRSQGEFKDAERMRKTKEHMLRSLKRLNGINQRANKQNL
jgi:hypothetical protein